MYGIETYDASGAVTLGMNDFTVRKIFEATFPAVSGSWTNGTKTDYESLSVPGYSAADCFVIISPTSYNTSAQNTGTANAMLLTPVFRDVSGTTIGIIRYAQDNWFDISNQIFRQRWRWCAAACIVEVFKVF